MDESNGIPFVSLRDADAAAARSLPVRQWRARYAREAAHPLATV